MPLADDRAPVAEALVTARVVSAVPVTVSNISKAFGGAAALHPLDLEIRAGELLSLLGPSGCGKTTTLRILAGFVAPDTGSVMLGTRDVTTVPPHRRGLGMVFQSYSLFPHMTVEENVGFGLRMQGVSKADRASRVREMLHTVRLDDFGDRYPAQLSGGQQQRVALARALITSPSVLLLDEPLAALDKSLRERVQFEIRDLQRRLGITTVLVTHDQEEALTMSDRVAVMSQGRLMQIGTPSEIYQLPETRFVSEFLGTSNLFSATSVGAAEQGRVAVRLAVGGVVQARAPRWPLATSATVTVAVRPEKLTLHATDREGRDGIFGVVKERIFRGSYHVLELDVAGMDTPVLAFSQMPSADLVPGRRAQIRWEPDDAIVLRD